MKVTKKLTIDDVRDLKLYEVIIVEELDFSKINTVRATLSRHKLAKSLDGEEVDYKTDHHADNKVMTVVRIK